MLGLSQKGWYIMRIRGEPPPPIPHSMTAKSLALAIAVSPPPAPVALRALRRGQGMRSCPPRGRRTAGQPGARSFLIPIRTIHECSG
jgi:hypothetical protein